MNKKEVKNLRFELSTKEYSDFWYAASLLGKTKKKEVLLEMIKIVKEKKS